MSSRFSNTKVEAVPKYGLKLKLNHVFPERKKQDIETSCMQIVQLFPLIMRYLKYYVIAKRNGRIPFIDHMNLISGQQIYGCPLGGIGTGTIGRGYKGEFCRFQLSPGFYDYRTVHANQFIVSIRDKHGRNIFQSVLSTYDKPKSSPNGWEWKLDGAKCNYTALYPRAWTEYDLSEYGVKLICRQISPIIPHNYKDSSLPCSVFVWEMENMCSEERSVNITFTWSQIDKQKCHKNVPIFESYIDNNFIGISLNENINGIPCTFTLSRKVRPFETLNEKTCKFNKYKNSKKIWQDIMNDGKFSSNDVEKNDKEGCNSMGLTGEAKLSPGNNDSMEFCLTWDMPKIEFQNRTKVHKRFYTRYFGAKGVAGQEIASYALQNYKKWENDIFNWQSDILDDENLPDWYKGAIMNELYYIADGGTVWFDVADEHPSKDPRAMFGIYGYLEGHEYRMYNTYDVHFYASFALAMLWPNLQVALQYSFKDAIPSEISTTRSHLYSAEVAKRKVANSVPHDMGDPDEEPFLLINAYNLHDVSEWRDLNPKFILQVFRDYNLLLQLSEDMHNYSSSEIGDGVDIYSAIKYLEDMYPVCCNLITIMKTWDKDNDGLIENCGFPDQTFDAWVMSGPSAYCGGLWLSALFAMTNMAKTLNKIADADEFEGLLNKGKISFENKLWTGEYYLFDSNPQNRHTIMADQLCGQWYLRSCGYQNEVFPKENVSKALDSIYKNNVKKFYDGQLGASNGFIISKGNKAGHIDYSSLASAESWTGVTYGVASLMLFEGKISQAFDTAGSMYNTISQTFGLNFETPEAFNENGNYRAVGYMRPLSIWSMQHALNLEKNKHRSNLLCTSL